MKILLNGEEREIPGDSNVCALLELAGFAERRVAIEVNRDIVPRSLHGEHRLVDGDQVEIVHAIGGG
ncbi:MAG: sulfur carrier protein ThiS [Dokdonella sp.]